jgi:hypothetical protein
MPPPPDMDLLMFALFNKGIAQRKSAKVLGMLTSGLKEDTADTDSDPTSKHDTCNSPVKTMQPKKNQCKMTLVARALNFHNKCGQSPYKPPRRSGGDVGHCKEFTSAGVNMYLLKDTLASIRTVSVVITGRSRVVAL